LAAATLPALLLTLAAKAAALLILTTSLEAPTLATFLATDSVGAKLGSATLTARTVVRATTSLTACLETASTALLLTERTLA
tara:strand:+ start:188 stop:433 length:246 start_codon:yes stop_codon:yes gene_type:complete